jgi:hypothetical protein
MSRNEVIKELGQYFSIVELVGPKEYKRDGDLCWRYLRTELLHTMLVLRKDILNTPMTVNTWKSGGRFDERGFRSNISDIVKSKTVSGSLYVSAHALGAAIDFDAKGMTAEQARNRIKEKQDLLPYPIRLESGTNWVHIDVYDSLGSSKKVTEF